VIWNDSLSDSENLDARGGEKSLRESLGPPGAVCSNEEDREESSLVIGGGDLEGREPRDGGALNQTIASIGGGGGCTTRGGKTRYKIWAQIVEYQHERAP